MGNLKEIKTILNLQNEVKELLNNNKNVTLKETKLNFLTESKDVTISEKIFRFANESPVLWGDFGIKKTLFIEKFGEEAISKFNLQEKNGIIIIPTHSS